MYIAVSASSADKFIPKNTGIPMTPGVGSTGAGGLSDVRSVGACVVTGDCVDSEPVVLPEFKNAL